MSTLIKVDNRSYQTYLKHCLPVDCWSWQLQLLELRLYLVLWQFMNKKEKRLKITKSTNIFTLCFLISVLIAFTVTYTKPVENTLGKTSQNLAGAFYCEIFFDRETLELSTDTSKIYTVIFRFFN